MTLTRMDTVTARNNFSELVNRVAYGNEIIILTRRGKDVAAIVPVSMLAKEG